jgi:general stress protein YciG
MKQEISKDEVREAARVLKSGGSKKRERRVAARLMSQAGSSKGGTNRARNLSPERRREIARQGGLARQKRRREDGELHGAKPVASSRALNSA